MVEGAARVLEAVSLIAVAVVAFILNAVTVGVFYNRPALRSPSNRFVLSLVGANFVAVLTLTPLAVAVLLVREPAPWLRTASLVAETNAVQASVLSTLAISLDRYNAVLSPLHYTINITRQRSRCLIALVWLLSACLSAPALCRQRACFPGYDHTFRAAYSAALLTIGFVIPLLTLFRVYVKMYAAAHRNSERTRRQSLQTSAGDCSRGGSLDSQFPPVVTAADLIRTGKAPTLAMMSKRRCSNASISALLFREEGRAVKTAVLVVATFVFSWGPFFLYLFMDAVVEEMPLPCEYFTVLATLLSAILSPFLYVYRNEIARNEGIRILLWWRRRGLYRGNVLQQACKDIDVKAIEGGMRVRHQTSSNCDSMSVQSFTLPTPFSPDCKQCAEIPQPPVADFVATYEIQEDDVTKAQVEPKPKTRGESVTFKLATLPQRKCGMCSRQNSDSSSGSGHPLLRETDSPPAGVGGRRYDRHEQLSRGSSFEDSPTFRGSPRLPPSMELDEPRSHSHVIFQFNNIMKEKRENMEVTAEDVAEKRAREPVRQDSDVTVDSGVEIDRSHSSSSSLSAVSPVVPRTKRQVHKLQRLAAVEDEETPAIHRTGIKLLPCDFG